MPFFQQNFSENHENSYTNYIKSLKRNLKGKTLILDEDFRATQVAPFHQFEAINVFINYHFKK